MARDSSTEAIILHSRETGDNLRTLTLLTPGMGLTRVSLFGGPKSKLRGLAMPYHAGTAWLYHDPVRDSYKLSDFDPRQTFPGIRESLRASYWASLWAELLLRTQAGGSDFGQLYRFLVEALEALSSSNETDRRYVGFLFLWGLAGMQGQQPEGAACVHCGRAFAQTESRLFLPRSAGFVCPVCSEQFFQQEGQIRLSPGFFRYLETVNSRSIKDALRCKLDERGEREALAFFTSLARLLALGDLASLESGTGIL
jgi:DNA repair protein RecO (recombination protein O)